MPISANESTPSQQPPLRYYHFASQNVLLSGLSPAAFGVAGVDRIWIAYDADSRVEFYRYNHGLPSTVSSSSSSSPSSSSSSASNNSEKLIDNDNALTRLPKQNRLKSSPDEARVKEEFVLEHTVRLALRPGAAITQALYCTSAPEYFCLIVREKSNTLNVYAYTNLADHHHLHLNDDNQHHQPSTDKIMLRRSNGELIASLTGNEALNQRPHPMENADRTLNCITFSHNEIVHEQICHISCCNVTGNLLIALTRGAVLLFRYARCILPFDCRSHSVVSDFVLEKTIEIIDAPKSGWCLRADTFLAKISTNYVTLMCDSHFAVLQLRLAEEFDYDSRLHNWEYPLDARLRPTESAPKLLPYNRLFDRVPLRRESIFANHRHTLPPNGITHADIVCGPIDSSSPENGIMGCRFSVLNSDIKDGDDNDDNRRRESPFNVLLCRTLRTTSAIFDSKQSLSSDRLSLSFDYRNETASLRQRRERNVKRTTTFTRECVSSTSLKNRSCGHSSTTYGVQLLPYRDRHGMIYAHGVFVLHSDRIDCYLIDLRRDKQRLIAISRLDLSVRPISNTPNSCRSIRDFTVSISEDIVHVLTDRSIDTYCSYMFNTIVSVRRDTMIIGAIDIPRYRMQCMSSCVFFDIVGMFGSSAFLFLIAGGGGGEDGSAQSQPIIAYNNHQYRKQQQQQLNHFTFYNLRRPSFDHLQADLMSGIDDVRSNSDDDLPPNDKHLLHQMYLQLYSVSKFACQFPARAMSFADGGGGNSSSTRTERVERFHQVVCRHMQEILAEKPTCDFDARKCPFALGTVEISCDTDRERA